MTYSVRHEGSPKSMDNLTAAQVVEGLQDGLWEPTDEVRGPQDHDWTAIENHPQFAEVALDLEPPPSKYYEDESRLDMTALIDVCLVLLIFFMIVTTYSALQKYLDAPRVTGQKEGNVRVIKKADVQQFMIVVKVTMQNGEPVILIEDKEVKPAELRDALGRFVSETRKSEMLLDYAFDVPHGTIVTIQDQAKGAGINDVHVLIAPDEGKRAP